MLLLNIPHRRQQRESDCLVACAAMVLDYLHVPIRYDRLYKLLRAQPFGTPAQVRERIRTRKTFEKFLKILVFGG